MSPATLALRPSDAACALPRSPLAMARAEARDAPGSGIVEVAAHAWGKQGLIPMWAGEGHLPTPAFIREACAASLEAGETFYTRQAGIPELREALADYHAALLGRPLPAERFYVTGSGMHAAQTAMRIVAGPGDEVLVLTPAWPNFAAAVEVNGARAVEVPLVPEGGLFRLDLDALAAAVTPRTRALVVNSPANPTGWTATTAELRALLDLARAHGLWIVADEIYGRFAYQGEIVGLAERAPSFHDVAGDEEPVLYVGSFSKNWAMTGWRVGWLEAPPKLGAIIENLIQYSTSGVATFLQRGAVAALREGEPFVRAQVAEARRAREAVARAFAASNRIAYSPAPGAFYAFFQVAGLADSRAAALRLVDEAGVVLAPGSAFGRGGEGFIRMCFARQVADVEEAARRILRFVEALPAPA